MSCIVWNARGLGNQRAFRELKRLIVEKDPHLLFLSETRMREYNCRRWKEWLNFMGMFVVNCEGKKGGLMLLWKNTIEVTIKSFSSGHIDSIVKDGEKIWRFMGFYGNPDARRRKDSWILMKRLTGISELKDLPWLMGGDFNELCHQNEKKGGRPRSEVQMDEFRTTVDACELREIYGEGDFFTWVNMRNGEDAIWEKLDSYLSNLSWRLLYPAAISENLEFYSSNHRALQLIWSRNGDGGRHI
ncbi:hypothetical protein DH2020_004029 [Rehmannia glutinosa]|uniref:Endonuclease/exonuclease/phosphatase domain-containing protein n=1 Tax=Rehmannia glutinosa TaxID=99300 RepID=A0ABR0XNM2_REHGL